jgi:hypothetical protein
MSTIGLLFTRDLFFASKVTGTAQALGLVVRSGSSLEQLRESVGADDLKLVILDLDCAGITPADVMAALPAGNAVSTVAFGPHVHEQQLADAREAGFHQVLPRSKFSTGLVEILKSALTAE